jgi:hypothetical protein
VGDEAYSEDDDGYYNRWGEPDRLPVQLRTRQYFYFWEERVPHAATEVLRQCVTFRRQGWAHTTVTINHTRQVEFSADVFPRSG